MKIEREKKYLIPENLAEDLKSKSVLKIGVIQWYIDDKNFLIDKYYVGNKYRLRLIIDKNFNKQWSIAIKRDLRKFEREEIEFEIPETEININALKQYKLTAKIRYYLTLPNSDPEIVLDEFLRVDKVIEFEIRYLLEIETFKNFEEIEKENNLVGFEVKDFKKFTNEKLAKGFSIETLKLIDLVYQFLVKNEG
ncbi:hypothetical protein [Thermosipho atlanticus]|uniref:CYTH domain-containing protein n=1 Tax=Thermosipho atlanticus DSM 15807 TaxID=1123380 RepID=A0A1M5R835_9BACT|nr:hypothetical protein [Thermosipho atlanticus]SHH22338.1 hypothetical protein SAMN02745199_0385 [Thermosipho atlanticus DSM 15807]